MATLASTPRKQTITLASASAGPFDLSFRLFSHEALIVFVDGAQTTGFTVQSTFTDSFDDAATITFESVQDIGAVIAIEPSPEIARAEDLLAGPNLTEKMNREEAMQWATSGALQQQLKRAPKVAPGSVNEDLFMPNPVAGKTMIGRADGLGWEDGPTADEVSNAQGYAEAAEQSASRVDLGALDDAVSATGADALQTSQDAAATGSDRTQTSLDAAASAAAAAAAAAARDAATINADVYASEADGRAAVADGAQFQVVVGDEVIRYERVDASTSTEVARFPTSDLVDANDAKALSYVRDGRGGYTTEYMFSFTDSTDRLGFGLRNDKTFEISDNLEIYSTRASDDAGLIVNGIALEFTVSVGANAFGLGLDRAGSLVANGLSLLGDTLQFTDKAENGALGFEVDGTVSLYPSAFTYEQMRSEFMARDVSLNGPGQCSGALKIGPTTVRYFSWDGTTPRHMRRRTDIQSSTAIEEFQHNPCAVFGSGESTSLSGHGDDSNPIILTDTPLSPHRNLMPARISAANNLILDPASLVDLVPAFEEAYVKQGQEGDPDYIPNNAGETFFSAAMATADRLLALDQKRVFIGQAYGQSGATLSALMPGTQAYGNMRSGIARTCALAGKYRLTPEMWFLLFQSGVNDGAGQVLTPKSTLLQLMGEYSDALNTHFAHMRPAGRDHIPLLMVQAAGAANGNGRTSEAASQAQYELQRDNPDRFLICTPQYHVPMLIGQNGHPSSLSQYITGEYIGRAIYNILTTGTHVPHRPKPTGGVTRSTTTITITLDVPEGNVVEDTTRLPEAPNKGFRVVSNASGQSVPLTSVGVTGSNEITLECASDPGPCLVSYARTQGTANADYSDFWGNFFDQSAMVSAEDPSFTLANPLISFEEPA